MQIDPQRIVATGTWLYDGSVPCRIIIQKEDVWPGSGDYEDDPKIAEDQITPCVSVWHESPAESHIFITGGGYYQTIDEAKSALEQRIAGPINWQ